jgi:hypothetical protein
MGFAALYPSYKPILRVAHHFIPVGTNSGAHPTRLYQRLQDRGKTKMSALGAAMRKLVHLCFGVLKTRLPYQANYAI